MLHRHNYVDVFEDSPGSDTECAIGGFDQVVSFTSAVMTAERINETKVGVQLFCFYQKASAIRFPFHGCSLTSARLVEGGLGIFDC